MKDGAFRNLHSSGPLPQRSPAPNAPPAVSSPEPVHDWNPHAGPTFTQSYAVAVIADQATRTILAIGRNAAATFGIDPTAMLDHDWIDLVDSAVDRDRLIDAFRPGTPLAHNPWRIKVGGHPAEAVLLPHAGLLYIELEPAAEPLDRYPDLIADAAATLASPTSIADLCQHTVDSIRATSGYDRVLLYRFDEASNGQVIAGSVREGVDPLVGLSFPASDITARARGQFATSFTRYIPDVNGRSHGLLTSRIPRQPHHAIDLTPSNLRRVAPCHIGYLRNMGIEASMSVAITIEGRLWGLVLCHAMEPRTVSIDRRIVCEQTAMMFAHQLSALTTAASRMGHRNRAHARIDATVDPGPALVHRIATLWGEQPGQDDDTVETMVQHALRALHREVSWRSPPPPAPPNPADDDDALTPSQRLLVDLAAADSAAVIRDGQVYRIGEAPSDQAIFAVIAILGRELPCMADEARAAPVYLFGTVVPPGDEARNRTAAVLAVGLSPTAPDYLIWFRRARTVPWSTAVRSDQPDHSRAFSTRHVRIATELAAVIHTIDDPA